MGCNCGSGSGLANYEVKDENGTTIKKFTAVNETEVRVFSARIPKSTWRKTS